MKHVLLVLLLLSATGASAQATNCSVPAYFARLPLLLGKGLGEALAEAGKYKMQFIDSEWTAEQAYLFKLHLKGEGQRVELVFIEGRCDVIWLTADQCICEAEGKYVKKWWASSEHADCYTDKKKTYNICLMQGSEFGCIAIGLP